jgi:6-phosphofructokinase 2
MLRQLLDAEHVAATCIDIAGEARENFSVRETSTGKEYRFVLPGPVITEREWQGCVARIDALEVPPRYLVLSGSVPPGVPLDIYARLARCAGARGTRIVVDTSGPALAAAVDASVWLVKPSLNELRELAGRPLASEPEWRAAAQEIVREGRARIVALTLGEQGALLVTAEQTLLAKGLPIQVSSSVGAGDSFIAALVCALDRDASLDEAFRYGMAAASATLLVRGTARCSREDVERLYNEVSSA